MALNSLLLSYTKINEIEENEPISPPSTTIVEKRKTIPNCYPSLYQRFYIQNNSPKRKNNSFSSLFNSKNLNEILFRDTSIKNDSCNCKNNNIEIPRLNKDKKRKIDKHKDNEKSDVISKLNINKEKKSTNQNYFSAFKVYKADSNRIKNNNTLDKNNIYLNTKSSEEEKDKNSNKNIYNRFRNKRIVKKDMNKSYKQKNLNYRKINKNNETNPSSENFDTFSFSKKVVNSEESLKIKTSKTGVRYAANTSTYFYNKNNFSFLNNKPYIKKKIEDAKNYESFNKKDEIGSSGNSTKRISLKTKINKKRPLILNVNLQKKNNIHIKISQFQRILKSDGIFYILRFLDYYDIINLLKTKSKKMNILINTALAHAYYFNIKESLLKYNNIIELLKCSIVKSQIKDSLKIDLIINVRFIKSKYNYITSKNKYEKNKNNFIEPLYYQFSYLYNYYQKIKPKKELITKEDYENQNQAKKLKIYDYYAFDLYPENYKDNDINNNLIFISKVLPIKEKDNNNIANVQTILPFLINDKGIINLELYTTDNGFIDPDSIRIIIKSFYLKNYLKMIYSKGMTNPRISEYEELCSHWKSINLYPYYDIIIQMIKLSFEPFFEIKKMYFENIGVFIFKTCLKAIKSGEINDKRKIGVKIKIKEKNEYIENEIRKNNLLFERRDIFEIRVGDELTYYFCMK